MNMFYLIAERHKNNFIIIMHGIHSNNVIPDIEIQLQIEKSPHLAKLAC